MPEYNRDFPILLERMVLSYPRQPRFAYELMPLYEAPVARDSYKIAKIGADHLELEDFKRAYGADAKRTLNKIEDWVVINTNRYTVESAVDRAELVGAVEIYQASLLLREARMKNAYDKLMNSIESEQIKSVLDGTKYDGNIATPSGNDLWDTETADIVGQIEDARTAIKNKIGLYPNKCIISDVVWQKLRFKKSLIDRLPTTTLRSGITPEDFAKIIAVEKVVVADNMYMSNGQLSFAWGKNVVLAYVPKNISTLEDTTFGVTVRAPLGYAELRDYFDDKSTSGPPVGASLASYSAE